MFDSVSSKLHIISLQYGIQKVFTKLHMFQNKKKNEKKQNYDIIPYLHTKRILIIFVAR